LHVPRCRFSFVQIAIIEHFSFLIALPLDRLAMLAAVFLM